MTHPAPAPALISRYAHANVAIALADTRVVLIVGPRQAGKTTLAREFVTAARPYVTLDDLATLEAARRDPVGFVRGLKGAVIDEIQRAPAVMLAIKQAVDADPTPGRFLLTGSANVMELPIIRDSLAGRLAVINLLPFAQAELAGSPGRFIDRLFAGERPIVEAPPVVGSALIEAILRGGYPEALRRADAVRRSACHEDYLALVLDRDVKDIAAIEQLHKLPRLMRMLAEQSGQLVNAQPLASTLGLSIPTVQKYVGVLERMFLLRSLAPWYSNRLSRLIKTSKLHFLDSGLLATLRGADAASLAADSAGLGALLECFAASEVLKLLSWSQSRASLSHFRTKDKDEIDLVLQDRRGRIVGLEIKSAATLRPKDFSGLRKLRDAAGDRFVCGLVLHDHDRVTPIDVNLHGAPISLLWQM